MLLPVDDILAMHESAIERWHQGDLDNPYTGFLHVACHQCALNYQLWHQEDIARSPHASDGEIAQVKRTIDRLNQQRNDYIERMDEWIAAMLAKGPSIVENDAPLNTETPGSVIDRLAILALRIFHLGEQLERTDVEVSHHQSVAGKRVICQEQRSDLATSLGQLLSDLESGRKRHKIYRQFKMYNDPALNPYLYQT